MSKYLSVKYLLISRKIAPYLKRLKKSVLGPILVGFPGEWPQKNLGDKIAVATQQLYTKIRFQCFVVLEKNSVKDLERKKEKQRKKRKKLHRGQAGLIGMKK